MPSLHDEAYALFVSKLATLRRESRVSQKALAKALGWNQSVISRVENVQRRLDIVEFLRISEAVGFDPARFIRELHRAMKDQTQPP